MYPRQLSELELQEVLWNSWDEFKVCCGCDILIAHEYPVCLMCKAYRFDATREVVHKALSELFLSKDFGVIY